MKSLLVLLPICSLLVSCAVSTKRPSIESYGIDLSRRNPSPQVRSPQRPTAPRDNRAGVVSSQDLLVNNPNSATSPAAPAVLDLRSQTTDQLRTALQDPQFTPQKPEILFRLGEREMAQRNTNLALNYFNQVIEQGPNTIWAQNARNNLDLLSSLSRVSPTTIGVILPLSGRNASLGRRMLKSIEMGLGLHYGQSNFQLAVIDTAGNPDKARRGVERLVKEDNVVAILGALSSREAESAALMADELSVPLITLSQRSGLTEISPYVYQNAMTPEMQIEHLVNTAMNQYGMKKFAILYPNDAYGVESANIFWDQVMARGGEITAAETYDPNSTNYKIVSEKLVGKFYIEARLDEYKAKRKEFEQKIRKRNSRENISAEDILDPIINFDAVFIPDSSKNMGQISAFLSYEGVKDIRLLGTNLWNSPGLARRAGHFADSLLFVGGFLDNSAAAKNSRFVAEFEGLFRDEPTIMEVQAYESALILRGLVMNGSTTRGQVISGLNHLENFPGALGPISMSSTREVLRPLYSLTLRKGEIIPLNTQE